MQVLIVDSSIEVIERLEEILGEADNITAIHSAVSYEEAARFLKENKTDVMLLDCSLPENGSLKLLTEIKIPGSNTCVIILSILEDNNYKEELCKSLGADYFLDKYLEFEKIPGILNAIAGKAQK